MVPNSCGVLFVLRSVHTGTPAYTCLLGEAAHAQDGKVHWALHFLHRQPAPRAHLHSRARHTRHFLLICARHLSICLFPLAILLSFSTARSVVPSLVSSRSFSPSLSFLPSPLLFLSLTVSFPRSLSLFFSLSHFSLSLVCWPCTAGLRADY